MTSVGLKQDYKVKYAVSNNAAFYGSALPTFKSVNIVKLL